MNLKILSLCFIISIFLITGCVNTSNKVNNKDVSPALENENAKEPSNNINPKYLVDQTYCENDKDCIFHPGLCSAINQYYKTEPTDTACNLAQCGAECINSTCKIDFSCLNKETCIPDNEPLLNKGPSECCSGVSHEGPKSCSVNPETNESSCTVTVYCGFE